MFQEQLFRREQGFSKTRKHVESSYVYDALRSYELSRKYFQKLSFTAGVNSIDLEETENRYLLAGYANGGTSIFDTYILQPENTIPAVAFTDRMLSQQRVMESIDGVQWYPQDTGMFLTLSSDRTVRVWDTNEMEVAECFGFKDDTYSFHLSKARKHSLIAVGCHDKSVYLVDMKSGSKSHTIKGHNGFVYCVKWSPRNRNILISASSNGEIFIWDVRKARPYLDNLRCIQNKAHNGSINGLQFTADGLHLLSLGMDNRVRLWDLSTFARVKIDYGFINNESGKIVQMSCTKELSKNLFFVPSSVDVNVFEILTGKSCGALTGHFQSVNACCFAPTFQELYTCAADSLILQWKSTKNNTSLSMQLHEDNWI